MQRPNAGRFWSHRPGQTGNGHQTDGVAVGPGNRRPGPPLRGSPNDSGEQPSAQELQDLVAVQRVLSLEQREMIAGALEIHERRLREILIPRRSVVTLASGMSREEARKCLWRLGIRVRPWFAPATWMR